MNKLLTFYINLFFKRQAVFIQFTYMIQCARQIVFYTIVPLKQVSRILVIISFLIL